MAHPLLRELRRDLAFVQSQLETVQDLLSGAESLAAEERERIANLQAQLAEAESVEEAQAISSQISEAQTYLARVERNIAYWSNLVANYEARIADLEAQIAELEAELDDDDDDGAGEV